MAKSEQGFRLPGGLILPAGVTNPRMTPKFPKLGKKPPEGEIGKKVVSRRLHGSVEVIHYASLDEQHKLDADARKERRADNKAMREIHSKTRKRKKHGR